MGKGDTETEQPMGRDEHSVPSFEKQIHDLRAELTTTKTKLQLTKTFLDVAHEQTEEFKAQVKVLREALEFYANKAGEYAGQASDGSQFDSWDIDRGKKAREALVQGEDQ